MRSEMPRSPRLDAEVRVSIDAAGDRQLLGLWEGFNPFGRDSTGGQVQYLLGRALICTTDSRRKRAYCSLFLASVPSLPNPPPSPDGPVLEASATWGGAPVPSSLDPNVLSHRPRCRSRPSSLCRLGSFQAPLPWVDFYRFMRENAKPGVEWPRAVPRGRQAHPPASPRRRSTDPFISGQASFQETTTRVHRGGLSGPRRPPARSRGRIVIMGRFIPAGTGMPYYQRVEIPEEVYETREGELDQDYTKPI